LQSSFFSFLLEGLQADLVVKASKEKLFDLGSNALVASYTAFCSRDCAGQWMVRE
jgi:hypothetical protein